LRRLWAADEPGRPLVALLCALARDPLLRATAPSVLGLPPGSELVRALLLDALREAVGERLSEPVLDKVARNAGSSWCQSGHLEGRVRKIRRRVTPTIGSLAFALWLGTLEGLAGRALLESRWARALDGSPDQLVQLALQAKQLGLIHARAGGGVLELDASHLDPRTRL
jgi:alkylhydroperoxidase family enzyme